MAEFTIKEREYSTSKLNALQQAHLMRRLLPIISSLAGLAKLRPETQLEAAKEAFAPMAAALSDLSDEQFNYIVDLCLGSVRRKEGALWTLIWNKAAKLPQYDDIDLMTMLLIIGNVIMDNLQGFLPAGPASLAELLSTVQK